MIKKNTISFVFYTGDTTFTWSSNKQSRVTLSIWKDEYIVTTSYICHSMWIRRLLKELKMLQEKPIKTYMDNYQSLH
jgi:hypothetical protein